MESVRVAIRVRPLNERELNSEKGTAWSIDHNSLTQYSDARGHPPITYTFDRVFNSGSVTRDVFEEIGRPIVTSAMEGINGTIFVYGQTSSGKTHTMLGDENEPGIIPRAIDDIFAYIEQCTDREFLLRVSFMEIYNEVISDLATPEAQNLKVKESIDGNIWVEGIAEPPVASPDEFLDLMELGMKNRKTASTRMNDRSSRSHTVFRIVIESRECVTGSGRDSVDGAVRVAHLNLVDLAGSERVANTGAEGQRLKEGAHINKSLLTLGTVIGKLSDGITPETGHIPYRDSKLTRILQNSLGGNARTAIVCTVTPAAIHVDESNSTLKFASRAKAIKNKAVINEVYDDAALLRKMKRELGDLKRRNEQLEDGSQVRDLMQKQEVLQEALRDREEAQSAQAKKIQSLTRLIISTSKLQVTDTGAMPETEVATVLTVAEKKARAKRRKTWCPSTSALKHSGRLELGSSEDASSKAERSSRRTRSSVMGNTLLEEPANDAATFVPVVRSHRRLAGRKSMMPALELGSGSNAAAASASGDVAGIDKAAAALANLRALSELTATGKSAGFTSSEGEIFKAKAQGLQRTLQSREHDIEELESRLEMTTSDLERTIKERENLRTQLAKQEAANTCEVEILRAELSDMRRQHGEAEAQASEALTRAQQHHERELREARENLEFLEHELLVYRSAQASPAPSPGGPDARATREEIEADVNRLQAELATAIEEREAAQKSLDEMNKALEAMTEARDTALSAQQESNIATQKAVCELEEVRASAHAAAEEALRQDMNAVRTESTEAQQRRQEAEEQAITMEMKLQRTETKLSELASELEHFRDVEKALDAPAGEGSDEEDVMRGGAKARLFADVLTTLACEEPRQAIAAITSLQEELRTAKERALALDSELKGLQQACAEAESSASTATQALEAWKQEGATLKTTLADMQKELEAVRTQRSDDVAALTTEIESLRVEICHLTESRDATAEIKAAAEKRMEEATAALETLKVDFDAATANVETLREAAARASDELKHTQEELRTTEETLHATTATLEATESALEAHQQISLQEEEKRACGVEAGMQCEPLAVADASAQVEMDAESNSAKRDQAAMELAEATSRVRELEEALSLAEARGGLRQADQPLPSLVQADEEAEAEAEAESEAGGQSPARKKGNFAKRTLHALKAKSPFVKRKRRLKPKVGRMSVGNEELTEFGMARVQSLETPAKEMLATSAGPGTEAIPMATIADVESDSDDDEVSFGTSGPKASTTSAVASAATMAELRGKLAALEAQVVASDQAREAAETAVERESARVRAAEAELNIVIDKLAASVTEHRQLEETAATHAAEREALEERLVSSASMLEKLQENLNEARQQRKATLERASEMEAQLTSMKDEHVQGASEASTRVAELEQRVAELETQMAELDAARALLQEQAQQSACAEAEAKAELASARAEVEQLETTQGEMIQDLDNAQQAREAAEAKALETEAVSATKLAGLTQLAAAMETANARAAEAEASGTALSAALSTAQEEAMVAAQAAAAAETRVTQLEAEITALKSQLQASHASLAARDAEVPANAERQQALEEEVAHLMQSLANAQGKLQQADSELVTLGLEREALATRNSELEQGAVKAHASLTEAEGVKTRLESQLEQMREELMSQTDELVASEQRCMTMEKEVEGKKRQLKEEKAKASKAKKRIATLEENIKGDDDYQEQQLTLLRRDYEAKTEEIRAAQAQTEHQAEEAAKAKAALLKAEVRIEQLTTEVMAAKAAAESVVSTARVSELEQELSQARARIGSLSADLETAQAHAEQLQDKLDDMKRERGEAALNAPGIVGMDANYSLKEENRRLKEAHAAQAREIERLEASVHRLTAALSAARASLAQHRSAEPPSAAAAAPDVVPGDNVDTKQILSAKRRPLSDANATDPRSPTQGPQSKRPNISLKTEPQTPSAQLYKKAQEVAKQRGLPAVVAATDPEAAAAKAMSSVGGASPQASARAGKPEDHPNECETQVQ